ncbi:acyl-CoA dehydrogenase [Cysteiniphilum halobium]|uniref:acyl-CoA dehydrogenase n=1 Tax=Cysteiniphilum halobium TaxID=2219059 RepID=UPI002287644E|nr:acyl-CoA dehydrogenase [Cysteiniphilum halobium]
MKETRMIKKIYKSSKKSMPPISVTEQVALDAGDCWYEKQVFQGLPDFDELHRLQKFQLNEEEQSFLDNETTELCAMIDDWQVTHVDRDLPVAVWNFIREKGFFGLVIRKEYGGKGFSAAAHSEIVMKIATKSVSAAVTVMVPNSLGPGELLHHYGTDEQKDMFLPKLAAGIDIPCFALTGPTAGSDATSLPDKGVVCKGEYNGRDVLGIRLENINKRYITLAPVATLVGLAFQLYDPNNLLGEMGKEGITCALLPHDHPGLEIGNRAYPLSQAFMNGTIRGKDLFIPIDWIIGGQKMAGEGWRMLVECLSIGRAISLPACGTANTLLSSVITSAYSMVREQFKSPIGYFEGVEEKLAQMGGLAYLANATRQFTVAAVDAGIKPSVASAISKYHLTEMGRHVINHAMDIHAGRAVIMGPNNYLARGYQATPVGITVEGANIMTRNLMIFGQGAMRCHPYVRDESESLMNKDEKKGFEQFSKLMKKHISYMIKNTTRTFWYGISCGATAKGYSSKFNKYYKRITRLSTVYACVNDIALVTLGGALKRKERLSARLGDVMSYLYMACAVLKYYKDNGEQAADDVFVSWSLQHCLYEAQNALCEIFANFPNKALAGTLRFIAFPYGKPFKKPDDRLDHKLAQALLKDEKTRQRMKSMCYVPEDDKDPIGRVELAYQKVLEAIPVQKKIKEAIKAGTIPKASWSNSIDKARQHNVISDDEVTLLKDLMKRVNDVIQTDEFSPYALGPKNAHPEWREAYEAMHKMSDKSEKLKTTAESM